MEDHEEISSLLHLKEYIAMWKHGTSLIRENTNVLLLIFMCIFWAETFPISCVTYLKSCSKPKWYNHVSVQLGPHIKYWHDEWNHQQLQCQKQGKKLPLLSQKPEKLKQAAEAISFKMTYKHDTSAKALKTAPESLPSCVMDLFKRYWES